MTDNKSNKRSAFHLPMQKNSQILAIFAIVCTSVVGLVNELTKDKIKAQEQQQLLSTLHSIIVPSRHDNDMTQSCVSFSYSSANDSNMPSNSDSKNSDSKNSNALNTAYIARKNNEPIAIAMTNTAPDGYNGKINLIVAINMDDTISGMRVLKHQETPGLGDKVELRKSDWVTSFNGKKLLSEKDNRWAVVKDGGMFDQFTGATITPRAVVKAVKKSLLYFKNNKQRLLTLPNSCLTNSQQSPADNEKSHESEATNE